MLASGFAGLGYQVVWTQQCAAWLGHESAAVLAVITAFFGGLALGGLLLGRRIEHSAHPARWYAACEALIGAWSLVLALLLQPLSQALLQLTGPSPSPAWQWTLAFVGTFVVLLPATAAMGATLPAMERICSALGRGRSGFSALYAANTLGAVLGVLGTAFWLVPQQGLAHTAMACAGLNLLCALAVLGLADAAERAGPSSAPSLAQSAANPAAKTASASTTESTNKHAARSGQVTASDRGPLLLLAATGLLGIGYEVLVVRVLSQVAENTVYTYALLLAVYLVGSALGAAAYQRHIDGNSDSKSGGRCFNALGTRLLWLQAMACLLGSASLWGAQAMKAWLLQTLGPGMASALWAEAALALAAFGPATVVMGALFSHQSLQARAAGHGFGAVLGWNTLGATAAPLLFGVLLLPALGSKAALLLVAGGYLGLSLWPVASGSRPAAPARQKLPPVAGAAAILATAALAPPLQFVEVPEGGRIVSLQDGAMATVSVVEDAAGVAVLRINNRQQEGSSATLPADARQAWLPLLLHPSPKRVLFLGLGTGATATSAAEDSGLQVDAVELLPEVIAASAHFNTLRGSSEGSSRLHVMAADARRYVKTADRRYDLVISDNFHPARSGSAALYTVEHFTAVRERLAVGGLFCQWLPLHQLDLATLRSIVRSFLQAYPGASAVLATNSLQTPVLGLIGRRDGERLSLSQTRQRLASATLPQQVAALGLDDEFSLLGSFVAGPLALAHVAGQAPLNTDDHAIVSYLAPRITYAPDSLPRDRLLALLSELPLQPAEIVDAGSDTAWPARLAAYGAARQRFLEAGRDVHLSADPQRMLDQVREPLLAALRTSPDFRPAYDPLLRLAMAQARNNPQAARTLLATLMQIQPARAEAARALAQLDASTR